MVTGSHSLGRAEGAKLRSPGDAQILRDKLRMRSGVYQDRAEIGREISKNGLPIS
jgi:hypothetical protein